MAPHRMIPVYVLTGFLGSGKTTLLNRLLRQRQQRVEQAPMGLVVNELGEVGVDGDLLPAGASRQVELPGGCICCVLNDRLDVTLLELVDKNPEISAIVLETTGVAEPLPILWSFERAPLSERFRLSAVITLVDALHFEACRHLSPAVDAQVAHADLVVLSKCDAVSPAALAQVTAVVRALAPQAPVVARSVDDTAAWLDELLADPALSSAQTGRSDHECGPGCGHDRGGSVTHGMTSAWVPISGVIDLEELEECLDQLPADYFRVKGIARVIDRRLGHDREHWVAFHRVGLRLSSEPITAVGDARMVAIGKDIDRARLAACIDASMVTS